MADRLIIFEDDKYPDFYPLALSRPVFSLRCGTSRLWETIAEKFPGYEIAFSCRPELASLLGRCTGLPVNSVDYAGGDRLVFINGRLCPDDRLIADLLHADGNCIFHQNDITAAVVVADRLDRAPAPDLHFTGGGASEVLGIKADSIAGKFEFHGYLWDLVNRNGNQIAVDFPARYGRLDLAAMLGEARIDSTARVLSEENFYIAPGAEIGAGAVIDNRNGPVIIDRDAVIGPLSLLEGPCYIGPETRVFRGNIRAGCSFGPSCRVGGEVEASIFQGYTNKYHDGFMGHAYVGSWVNLGAMTTNSDLKNNYRDIAVTIRGRIIQSGQTKIGSYIGDHSKTGIGTLINTGLSIGFSCNIFGGTLITSPEVLSFSWGDERGYDVYRLDKAIEVARTVMARRNVEFTEDHRRLFTRIYEETMGER